MRDHVGDSGDPHAGAVSSSPDIILLQAQIPNPQSAFGEGSGFSLRRNEPQPWFGAIVPRLVSGFCNGAVSAFRPNARSEAGPLGPKGGTENVITPFAVTELRQRRSHQAAVSGTGFDLTAQVC